MPAPSPTDRKPRPVSCRPRSPAPLRGYTFLLGLVAAALLFPPMAGGQAPTSPPELTIAAIEDAMRRAQGDETLPEETRTRIAEWYTQAIEQIKLRDEWRAQAEEHKKLRAEAPALVAEIQKKLAALSQEKRLEIPPDMPLLEVEALFARDEEELNQARAELAALEKEQSARSERRRELPNLRAAAQQQLNEIETQLSAADTSGEAAPLATARQTLLRATAEALRQQVDTLSEEAQRYDARGALLTLRLDQATRRVNQAEKRAAQWRYVLPQHRQREAMKAAENARQALFDTAKAPPEIRAYAEKLAKETAEFVEQRVGAGGLIEKQETARRDSSIADSRLSSLRANRSNVESKVKAGGRSHAVGILLRTHKNMLPDLSELERGIRRRDREIAEAQLAQLDAQEKRRALADIQERIRTDLSELTTQADAAQRETLAGVLRELYEAQRASLDALQEDYEEYIHLLAGLDAKEKELAKETEDFLSFINEHILWVRSGELLGLKDINRLMAIGTEEITGGQARTVFNALLLDLISLPGLYLLSVLAVGTLFFARPILRNHIKNLTEAALKRTCVSFQPTYGAAILSLFAAIRLPLPFFLLGWRLASTPYSSPFAYSTGEALKNASLLWMGLAFLREITAPDGLGPTQFGWAAAPLKTIHRTVTRGIPPLCVLIACIRFADAQPDLIWDESLGRMAFIVMMVYCVSIGHSLLRPGQGAIQQALDLGRKGPVRRPARLLYIVSVMIPLILLIAAFSGYYYSALRISILLGYTLLLGFVVTLANALVMRWLSLARRRIAIEQLRRRREAERAQGPDPAAPEIGEQDLDLARVDAQTTRLVHGLAIIGLIVGCWFIWDTLLPALSAFDKQLHSYEDTALVERVDAEGKITLVPETIRRSITIRRVLLTLLAVALTLIGARNLPGLLEITVLQRLPMLKGERYAITTIFRYTLLVLGGVIIFSMLGFRWDRIQWLVAALGVGLGFGLQEIVANFVSGIIILFERPIRVGDTVTVGNVSGTVTQINFRATAILGFNRKELIVPNKEFITGQVVNWTLSDQTLRIEIPVGIAYGSNTQLAKKLMLQAAHSNELILPDPPPQVYFMGFGDNALNFELRVFVGSIDAYLNVIDALHMEIDHAFREAGIEIAFPQRDIHIRSIAGALPLSPPPAPAPSRSTSGT